jgi:RecA-family ATPase
MLTPEEVQKVKDYMKTARHHGADEYDTDHIRNLTPTQIDTWIDNNVSDLVSAKSALKKMGRAILFLYKRLEIDG